MLSCCCLFAFFVFVCVRVLVGSRDNMFVCLRGCVSPVFPCGNVLLRCCFSCVVVLCCCVVLLCCCVVVWVCCLVVALLCCCVNVRVCWYLVVLLCCCVVVLLC